MMPEMSALFSNRQLDLNCPEIIERGARLRQIEFQYLTRLPQRQQPHLFQRVRQLIEVAPVIPSYGRNAQILSEIVGFNGDTIPENYCCSLSAEIMDDPVYDPAHPQYKFERA